MGFNIPESIQKFTAGFLIGVFFITFTSWIISGTSKESKERIEFMHMFNSTYPELITVFVKNGVQPSHQKVMQEIIHPTIQERMLNYDTVYVCCLPFRTKIDSEAVYTVTNTTIYVFHAFAPKRNYEGKKEMNLNPHVIYDPQGDSAYVYCASYFY